MRIKNIVLFPIKSCKGIELQKCEIDPRGIVGDRSMMLTFEDGRMLTQRDHPLLSLVQPALDGEKLTLGAPGQPTLSIDLKLHGPESMVSVWKHNCLAIDQGDEVAEWFSSFLKVKCRLVRTGSHFERTVALANFDKAEVGFADHSPMVIATHESLGQLNAHLCEPMMISRFRANIIIEGCQMNEEYHWDEVQFGDVVFQVVKDCARCLITCVEQETGARGVEPLKTLAVIGRRSDNKPVFGVHAVPTTLGEITLSSNVSVKVRKQERAAIP
ncbi:MAG TPA: MOSC N-terminal beta barrel domain-containing protein [Oculatellaceae cyanobacterium]